MSQHVPRLTADDEGRPNPESSDAAHPDRPDLTLVVPTRGEAENIGPLVDRVTAAAGTRRVEIVFVDDSDDDTPEEIFRRAAGARLPVRMVHRDPAQRRGGLGGAVVEGLRAARAEWVVVMDGDLQHPPELAVRLADVGRARGLDLVVATRHLGGGDAHGLDGAARHTVSRAAAFLARSMFPRRLALVSDPMSGLFAIRRDAVDPQRLEPLGFKILMEIMIRYPRLRLAEVPFSMAPRHAGHSKATLVEGARFARHLLRLRCAVLGRQINRSAATGRQSWLLRMVLFGLIGLSGLLVNTAVLLLLGIRVPQLHYLAAAVLATEASTTWLFLLTERVVFRGRKPGSVRSRAVRFYLLNHLVLLGRLPVLAMLVEWVGIGVVPANVTTLVLMFLARFLVADAAIYGAGATSAPAREPMRIVVDVGRPGPTPVGTAAPTHTNGAVVAPTNGAVVARSLVKDLGENLTENLAENLAENLTTAPLDVPPVPAPRQPEPTAAEPPAHRGVAARHRYLPYRYRVPGVATIGSQVRLRELEYFRAQYLGHDTDIQVRVGALGARPSRRATMTQLVSPPSVRYSEHLGPLGANFDVALGSPIVVTVAPALARSPHVVYTNVLEALLRFVAVSRGAMLLHSACLEVDGVGVLISAETDTGKTGTVLRMVRERGARFLSDDMTVLHADGRVGCFPKPLTISHHTLRAIGNDELTAGEWRRLRLQSRLHSKEGREFAMVLARLNIPIMGVNALTQYLVPPPKYTVDRLLPCDIVAETTARELFIISRGPHGAGALSRCDAIGTLLANTEDAYQFPPFRQLAPSVVIAGSDHAALRRREQEILRSALANIRCRWISTPDFSWADEIPRILAEDGPEPVRQLSSA